MPDAPQPLEPVQRVRRALKICRLFAANLAFYRSRPHGENPDGFGRVAANNFLDHATLEWCKIFGDGPNAVASEHSWKKVIRDGLNGDETQFFTSLLAHLEIDAAAFEVLRLSARTFRDKFIAHLDEDNVLNVPQYDKFLASIFFFHDFVREAAPDQGMLLGNHNIHDIYEACLLEGANAYPGNQV